MNALAGYGSSSDSDADAPAAPPAPPAAASTPTARHDEGLLENRESDEAEAAAPAAVSTSGLPSAASLLDGGARRRGSTSPPGPRRRAGRPGPGAAVRGGRGPRGRAAVAAREAQEASTATHVRTLRPRPRLVGKQSSNIEHGDMRGYGGTSRPAGRRRSNARRRRRRRPNRRRSAAAAPQRQADGQGRVKQQRLNGRRASATTSGVAVGGGCACGRMTCLPCFSGISTPRGHRFMVMGHRRGRATPMVILASSSPKAPIKIRTLRRGE